MKRKKSKKSKKTKRNSKNRHHIIPSSRRGKEGENITLICQACHSLYHKNFGNMTPVEIINFLVDFFYIFRCLHNLINSNFLCIIIF